jgi:hypothetical protein
MVTLTQMAASTAPCQFSVSVIDAEGNPYDPSGDEVEVAYWAVTSPQVPFDADTATWYDATFSVQAGNPNPTYWVNFLPGPLNGGIPLAAGAYIVVGRVVDNPAVPILKGCYLVLS